MDLYGSFKLGIRHLSVQGKEKKRPEDFVKGDDAVDEYMESLNNLLCFLNPLRMTLGNFVLH